VYGKKMSKMKSPQATEKSAVAKKKLAKKSGKMPKELLEKLQAKA
jgi:hypothetical protein